MTAQSRGYGVAGKENSDTLDETQRIRLIDTLSMLGEQKVFFLVLLIVSMAVVLGITWLLPRQYIANTLILPPQQQQQSSAIAALGQLGALAGVAGGIKTPDDLYLALLKTRSVQDVLIKNLKLLERFETTSPEFARKSINDRVVVTLEKKTGLIMIEVTDRDPKFAAVLANAYVQVLKELLSGLALTEAQQRRQFFEQQLDKTRKSLVVADQKFRTAQARSGFVVSHALAEGSIQEGLKMRSMIAAREIQLQSISRYATERSQEYQQLLADLVALRRKLSEIEFGGQSEKVQGGSEPALEAYREVKVQESVLEMLVRQYEAAKLDEAREGPAIQQVDPAVVPEGPASPKRNTLLLVGLLFSTGLALAAALLRAGILRERTRNGAGWSRLVVAWTGRTHQ